MKFRTITNDPNPMLERGRREKCLATFWHQATPGTTYWRCLVPARHLPAQSIPFRHDDLKEKQGKPYLPRQKGDVAVWQFLGDEFRSRIALGIRELHGTRMFMEVDDNYLRQAPYMFGKKHSPWHKTMEEARGKGGSGYSHEAHRLILPHMDGVLCSTPYLAERYSEVNPNVWVCPNSVDPDDWQYEREPHDDFRIVYYGSPSHTVDTPLVTKALKWAAKQPNVTIYTVGFQNKAWSFPHQHIRWNPNLIEARKNLFKFDLGIAPLKGNEWSKGKSDVKAMEYAMAGVLPVLSDEVPYSPWKGVVPMASNEAEWGEIIQWAVANPAEVTAFADEAKRYVLDKRTIHSSIHLWREALGVEA